MTKLHPRLTKNSLLISLFVALCLLIFFVPISSALIAQGYFSYDTQKRAIEHLEGGIVEEVLIKNGQEVKRNQPLIALSALKSGVDRNNLRQKLLYLIVKKQILELEQQQLSTLSNLKLNNIIQFFLHYLSENERRELSYSLLVSQEYLQSSIKKYQHHLKMFDDKKKNILANLANSRHKLKIIEQQIVTQKMLVNQNIVDDGLLTDLYKQSIEAESVINNLYHEIEIIDHQKQIFRHENIIDITLKIIDSNLDIALNRQALQLAEDVFERSIIYAPIDGIVEDLQINSAGAIIKPNMAVLYLVPKIPDLLIIGKVKPADIDNLALNQQVEVFLKNFYEKNIPKMRGQITEISSDIRFDDNLRDYFFEIKIKLISQEQVVANKNLKSGMVVDIFIKQPQRSIFSYILAPIKNSINRSFNDLQ